MVWKTSWRHLGQEGNRGFATSRESFEQAVKRAMFRKGAAGWRATTLLFGGSWSKTIQHFRSASSIWDTSRPCHNCNRLSACQQQLSGTRGELKDPMCFGHMKMKSVWLTLSVVSNAWFVTDSSPLNSNHGVMCSHTLYIWSEHFKGIWLPQWSLSLCYLASLKSMLSCFIEAIYIYPHWHLSWNLELKELMYDRMFGI